MGFILKTLILGFIFISTGVCNAYAQIAPGTPVTGEVEGRFLGQVFATKSPGVYVAAVTMDGAFKNGVPFEGPVFLDIETSEVLTQGQPIRGRVQAIISGEVAEYSDEGLKFNASASTVDYEWETIQAFGGASKGGGTDILRLELADIIFSISGSSGGNDI